jgi:hypothetical protein
VTEITMQFQSQRMRRLVAADLVPERAGQPVKALVHISLAELLAPAGTTRAREALEQAIIGTAADLLSGPGGLASFLRRRQLGARLAGPSLPLDIGYSQTIPAGIRVIILDPLTTGQAGRTQTLDRRQPCEGGLLTALRAARTTGAPRSGRWGRALGAGR